jgi:hypothetical protein
MQDCRLIGREGGTNGRGRLWDSAQSGGKRLRLVFILSETGFMFASFQSCISRKWEISVRKGAKPIVVVEGEEVSASGVALPF